MQKKVLDRPPENWRELSEDELYALAEQRKIERKKAQTPEERLQIALNLMELSKWIKQLRIDNGLV